MKKIITFFASLKLSCALFFILFVLTVLGTIDQKFLGLHAAQKKYFESLFLIYDLGQGSIPVIGRIYIPLPGVYLTLILLSINTIVGSFVRIKLKPEKMGIWITHTSILMLFISSFITFHFSIDGHMTMAEGQTKNTFESFHDWEFVVTKKEPHNDIETIYPLAQLKKDTDLKHKSIPFEIKIDSKSNNSMVRRLAPMFPPKAITINDYYIEDLKIDKESERNIPALVTTLKSKDLNKQMIIWGGASALLAEPISFQNQTYTITLRKKQWNVPFAIKLINVTKEDHPGTMMAKSYRSVVEKFEANNSFKHDIYMNHPLRYKGYTFFQSGYEEDPNTKQKISTFSVVKNPTDRWPEYACYFIGLGMLIHFGITFYKFLTKKNILK